MAFIEKKAVYKVFVATPPLWDVDLWDVSNWDNNPDIPLTTWNDDVITTPAFNTSLSSGAASMTVRLNRPYTNFGEGNDIRLNNRVEVWIYDNDFPNGTKFFEGYISKYTPIITPSQESVEVILLGYFSRFGEIILEDGNGDTTITYNSMDVSDILVDVLQKASNLGARVFYDSNSIQTSNQIVSYTFKANTIADVIKKLVELAPDNWFIYMDGTSQVYFFNATTTTIHQFAVGAHIQELRTEKNLESVLNKIYGIGGEPTPGTKLFRLKSDQGSITAYGAKSDVISDSRVTVAATMDTLIDRQLDFYSQPLTRTNITVLDNSGDNAEVIGYDIESVKVGDRLKLYNLKAASATVTLWDMAEWDVDVWDNTFEGSEVAEELIILSINYDFDSITIEAADRLPQVTKRIEDINRNSKAQETIGLPTSPN